MSCSTNTIAVAAETAVSFAEEIPTVLAAYGDLTPTQSTTITNYATDANNLIDTVIQNEQSGGTVLDKIAEDAQAFVTQYNTIALGLPPQITLVVDLTNMGIQALAKAIDLEKGLSTTTAVA